MADPHELEIEIAPDGETTVHVKGLKGKRCLEYLEAFRKLLGEVRSQRHTGEYYQPEGHAGVDLNRE